MKSGDLPTTILAIVGTVGLIAAALAWFYKRGGHERAIVDALKDNTASNKEVTKELRDFKTETLVALRDHDWRLKILEGAKDKK